MTFRSRCASDSIRGNANRRRPVRALGGFLGLGLPALHDEQIQWFGFSDPQDRQNRMGLSSMMRLVIEEMGEYFPARLPLRRAI